MTDVIFPLTILLGLVSIPPAVPTFLVGKLIRRELNLKHLPRHVLVSITGGATGIGLTYLLTKDLSGSEGAGAGFLYVFVPPLTAGLAAGVHGVFFM
jgi:hypothetical protein